MKLLFGANDSIYKIFTTLEKLRQGQTISLIIHNRNEMYHQIRRWKQIKALLDSKKIQYVVLCKHNQVKKYCEEVGLEYEFQWENRYTKAWKFVYGLVFKAKDFHLNLLQQDKYILYSIGLIELIWLAIIFYIWRYLLLPSATIVIKPNYFIEDLVYNFRYVPIASYPDYIHANYLTIPYYTWSYQTTFAHSWRKPDQTNQSSVWWIKITNEMTVSYTIRPGTRFVTSDGLVFKTSERVTIPAATSASTGVVDRVLIKAEPVDEQWVNIGSRGNLKANTTLLIKNLSSSFFLKKVIGTTIDTFSGGDVIQSFSLTTGDIVWFKNDASQTFYKQKQVLLSQWLQSNEIIPFKYNDLISATINNRKLNQSVWQKVTFINGDLVADLWYKYILKKDLEQAIVKYLQQRPAQNYKLIDINTKSLIFYNNIIIDYTWKVIIIPTKLSIIKWYDFEQDLSDIKQSLINKITGVSIDQARLILQEYDNIGLGSVIMSPSRYTTLPATKSRIYIDIQD